MSVKTRPFFCFYSFLLSFWVFSISLRNRHTPPESSNKIAHFLGISTAILFELDANKKGRIVNHVRINYFIKKTGLIWCWKYKIMNCDTAWQCMFFFPLKDRLVLVHAAILCISNSFLPMKGEKKKAKLIFSEANPANKWQPTPTSFQGPIPTENSSAVSLSPS